jgi:Ca2+-transporting ATPase
MTAPSPTDPPPWHALSEAEVLARLDTSRDGLSDEDAARRRTRLGPNALAEVEGARPLALLLAQFRSLLVLLLVAAGAVSVLLHEWLDAAAILAIVVLNAAIGFWQEYSAERSIAALRKLTAPRARVRRGGQARSVPAADLVPGDVVPLEAGDVVPADVRLLESASLRTLEAALTGESEPVGKRAVRLDRSDVPLADRTNLCFMATSVAAGTGLGVVVATGMATELGRIAHLLAERGGGEPATPLQRRLDALGRALLWASLAIVAGLFAAGLARGFPLAELVLTSISLAVAAVPEGLPAVVTIALALGVTRMARRRALIRRLAAVETLGAASVICADKTGTLTRGEMTVRALLAGGQSFAVSGDGYAPVGKVDFDGREPDAQQLRALRRLLVALVACNDARLVRDREAWNVLGDPTEGALLAAGAKLGVVREELERELPRAREWPFDSDRKRMSVAVAFPSGERRLLVKGAPDVLLERCTRVLDADGVRPLSDADRRSIGARHAELAERALRVLGAAERELPPGEPDDPEVVEKDLVFLGLAGMYDAPRPEAGPAVQRCRTAGIRVVMITGDHPRTALAVARELGLADGPECALSSVELDRLSDDELRERAPQISVYARVTAEHKLRIVRAWQRNGAIVAMTGDGVNDAPAIKAADVGVAMGITGTEVTKEASDMIVTDDDFASIVAAVEEGRGVWDNIKKTLHYLLAGNTGELLLMGGCIAVGLPVPLLPIHLLWINLVTDGLPALCLATDPIDRDVMRGPPRPAAGPLADRTFVGPLVLAGVLTAGVSLAVYLWGLRFEDEANARSHAFATLVFAEIFRAFGARSEIKPLWRIDLLSNLRLAGVAAATFAFQIASHHVGFLQSVFKTAPLGWAECLALVAVSTVPLLGLELAKPLWRRRHTSAVYGGAGSYSM